MSEMWPGADDDAHLDDEPAPASDYLLTLKRLTNLFDRAMSEERVSATTRARVVARVLHGTPTPGATPDWAKPEPRDLAVLDALAKAAPGRVHRVPPANA